MNDDPFIQEIESRLAALGEDITLNVMGSLKADFRNLTSIYGSLMTMLKNRSILPDDQYQYEEKISEITPITAEPFLEGAKATVISTRMHAFERQLKFLNDFYAFSLEHMTLARLKNLTQFLRFVRWDSFSESSQEGNTRALAELVAKVRKGDDAILAGLAKDIPTQIAAQATKIFESLKKVSTFKREEYKVQIRRGFWGVLNLAPEEVAGNPDNVQKRIKKDFAIAMKGYPYVSELIKELLDEDFGKNSEHFRGEVLLRLSVVKVVKEKPKPVDDPKLDLMEAVRAIGSLNIPFDAGLKKLQENVFLMDHGPSGIGEVFQTWFRTIMGIKSKPNIYEIELYDNVSNSNRTEQLNFTKWSEDLSIRLRLLTAVANRASPQFQGLLSKSEDEVLDWFDRQFIEASKAVERMAGLDEFFKTEAPKDTRSQVKGIKTEISSVRTGMANANKLKHDYVGKKEEQEQLKRLGIRTQ